MCFLSANFENFVVRFSKTIFIWLQSFKAYLEADPASHRQFQYISNQHPIQAIEVDIESTDLSGVTRTYKVSGIT